MGRVAGMVLALLKGGLSGLSDNLKGLPPESYGISVSESRQFDLHVDDMPQIVSASWNYCYTFISKDSGTPAPDSYQGVQQRLHRKMMDLKASNSDLFDKVVKLEKQKKQQGKILFLGTAAVVCFFILLVAKQSLDETKSDLNQSQFALIDTQLELKNTKANLDTTKKQSEEMQSTFFCNSGRFFLVLYTKDFGRITRF